MTNAEAIETLRANYPDACFEQLREAVDAAIDALKAQAAVSDWIPVTERMPEEWKPVLCLIQYSEGEAQLVLWYLGNGHWRETWRGDMIASNVTHWMPLPEPPKEET